MTADEKEFRLGYVMAVANLMHLHDQPTIAADLLAEAGLTLPQIRGLGLSDFDMKPVAALFRTEARLRRRDRRRA
jgi:hypothetical protein